MLEKIKYYIKNYGLAAVMIILSFTVLNAIFGQVCLSKIFFGLPCPACGMTRAFLLLLQGQWKASLSMNPMLIPTIIMCVVYLIIKKILKKSFLFLNTYAIICLLTLILVYIYRMYLYFPIREPYTYYNYNLLHIIISLIRKILN